MEAATADRKTGQLAEVPEDDGLGPVEPEFHPLDPNSPANSGIPGGRVAGDDGFIADWSPPEPGEDEPPAEDPPPIAAGAPPTPAATLPEGEDEELEEDAPQLFLDGSRQLGMKVGGRKPETSVLKFKGGKVDLSGQFDLEERITTVDIWQVTGDNNTHTIEKASGSVKASAKAQSATLCATRRLEDYLADHLVDRKMLEAVCEALDLDYPDAT